jgi:hypothetical protein
VSNHNNRSIPRKLGLKCSLNDRVGLVVWAEVFSRSFSKRKQMSCTYSGGGLIHDEKLAMANKSSSQSQNLPLPNRQVPSSASNVAVQGHLSGRRSLQSEKAR